MEPVKEFLNRNWKKIAGGACVLVAAWVLDEMTGAQVIAAMLRGLAAMLGVQ